jgi:hypothetical protein
MENFSNGSRIVANRDINATSDLGEAYPALSPLIDNIRIADAFALHERAAIKWKRIYERLGRAGLLCVLLAMIVFDYQVTLQHLYGNPDFLNAAGAGLAILGLASQIILLASHAKDKWITQRFVAERLRCLKFQAFAQISRSSSPEILRQNVTVWTNEALASLKQEMMGGLSAVLDFSPSEHVVPCYESSAAGDPALVADGLKIYDALRLNVQAQHFAERHQLAESKARWPEVVSQFCFGAGALLAFAQILETGWSGFGTENVVTMSGYWQAWLAFATLLLFIVSAVVAVYQRGSAHQPDAERYLTYLREVRRIRMLSGSSSSAVLAQSVREMETVALREIHDFCRDSRHSNFIL